MPLSAPELLGEGHNLEDFNCGEPALDDWLKQRALANQAAGASRVFVCCDPNRVVGYYSLSAASVIHARAPGRVKRNMPNPIPVVLLGRLAVDLSFGGQSIGRSLFKDAAMRISNAAETIGIRAIVVHPISDKARQFYLRLGFTDCPGEPMMMTVTLAEVRIALGLNP